MRIVIDYARVDPVRVERIGCLLDAACRVLGSWSASGGLRAALCAVYARHELEILLLCILRLYAVEARYLGESVQLPLLLAPLRQPATARVFEVMGELGARLANDIAGSVHDRGRASRRRVRPTSVG